MGMWLLQECRREWARLGQNYSYDDLTRMASSAPAHGPLILTSDPSFLPHGDMVPRIQAFCKKTGQEPPRDKGAVVRCILESLAMEYRWVAERLDDLTGRYKSTIHIIVGGARNTLLNQLTADVTHRTVVAGPVEATAIGNVLVQALALGHIRSQEEGREVVRRSFGVVAFQPQDSSRWDEAYQKYLKLKNT
jgi:rhamnulokinase